MEVESEDSLACCSSLKGGAGMDGDSVRRVCLDVGEDVDADRMRERQ